MVQRNHTGLRTWTCSASVSSQLVKAGIPLKQQLPSFGAPSDILHSMAGLPLNMRGQYGVCVNGGGSDGGRLQPSGRGDSCSVVEMKVVLTTAYIEVIWYWIMGKEGALFVPSGTMGDLISVLVHCEVRGSEVILGDNCHIHIYENGGVSTLGGECIREP
ncbi:hypothetical protein RJ639_000014 [Escallonia herrerae]|uniref:Aromatic amino acid beta-eliminating lyase/threonine aldolase domain-containing protein n=1 Tax=Escallonia herrerae TaxID=1293975 RepID=A0AA89BI22_9ASTE|nr:hypothetical protein RJ639_000014 [Escallonia herrerae]